MIILNEVRTELKLAWHKIMRPQSDLNKGFNPTQMSLALQSFLHWVTLPMLSPTLIFPSLPSLPPQGHKVQERDFHTATAVNNKIVTFGGRSTLLSPTTSLSHTHIHTHAQWFSSLDLSHMQVTILLQSSRPVMCTTDAFTTMTLVGRKSFLYLTFYC